MDFTIARSRDQDLDVRLGTMAVILAISLFAVSFPALSKRTRYLSIPKILFFIGKHFGTGVILSTAFVHLLQDSFEALQDPLVDKHYNHIGKQAGLIILGSLLIIFLVEYASTSYVDHLHADPSAPPSPLQSPIHPHDEVPLQASDSDGTLYEEPEQTEITPLLSSPHREEPLSSPQSPHTHPSHKHRPHPVPNQHYLAALVRNSPRHSRSTDNFYMINDVKDHLQHGEYHIIDGGEVGGRGRCLCVTMCPPPDCRISGPSKKMTASLVEEPSRLEEGRVADAEDEEDAIPRIGRKRQVVGILVLQLGIMIHSLVIGLTLSITKGSDFTSLVTAIAFHQLFEGLSLGIRIAGLPPAPGKHRRRWLQPTLAILFAITTPIGIGLGLILFDSKRMPSPGEPSARMLLMQGVMSAVSAGMLIYAATVEMLAGDFVFGSLGHGGSGHTHAHAHGEEFTGEDEEGEDGGGAGWKRRVLAVVSLLAGVGMMALIGIGE